MSSASENQIFHFLSSAARRQYAEDIVMALALPRGAYLQLRYSKQLLEDEVNLSIKTGDLRDSQSIISFLDSSKKGVPPQVFPCRKGTIVKADFFGPFAVVVLSVGDFLFNSDPEAFTATLQSTHGKRVPQWKPKADDLDLVGHWVFQSSKDIGGQEEGYDFSIFANATRQLSALFPFNDKERGELNPFFHVSVHEGRKKIVKNETVGSPLYDVVDCTNGTLLLKPSQKYKLCVHH